MQLQRFVTAVIEAMGGIVIPLEYALCQVMIPEPYKDLFLGREELELVFDYEVAEENPQAEFVTFGSYLFEEMVSFVQRKAVSTVRFVDIDPPVLSGALEKIRRFLSMENGVFTLRSERSVTGVWAVFAFHVGYVSDEKEEDFHHVWIDLSRSAVCEDMRQHQDLIAFTNKPVHHDPLLPALDITSSLSIAYGHAKKQAEPGRLRRTKHSELEREQRRINDYYEDLKRETIKRSERKGLSEQKKQELLDKIESIGLEQHKQLAEMDDKYSVRIETVLDHGMLVVVPLLEYVVSISTRKEEKVITLHYNPILKRFAVIEGFNRKEFATIQG